MDCFSSFNIVGYSSPLLPCRLVDLRRGLIYIENLQHPPLLSFYSSQTIQTVLLQPMISCLSQQYLGLYLSPTLPTLLPASDIPDRCTIRGLLHKYRNLPPTNYFHISLLSALSFSLEVYQLPPPLTI